MANTTNLFMARAIALAVSNAQSGRGGPFGAVIVRAGEIIAEAANCVTATNDPTAHAEVMAIREACKILARFELKDCEIYASCEPCPMCLGAIYWARMERLYFASTREDATAAGFDDSLIYEELAREPGDRKIPMIQTMRQEGAAAFNAWSNAEHRTSY